MTLSIHIQPSGRLGSDKSRQLIFLSFHHPFLLHLPFGEAVGGSVAGGATVVDAESLGEITAELSKRSGRLDLWTVMENEG